MTRTLTATTSQDALNILLRDVLALTGGHYVEHGVFARGDTATSRLLDGFTVEVAAVFGDAG